MLGMDSGDCAADVTVKYSSALWLSRRFPSSCGRGTSEADSCTASSQVRSVSERAAASLEREGRYTYTVQLSSAQRSSAQ